MLDGGQVAAFLHPGLLVAGCIGGRGLHSSTFQLNLMRF